MELDQALKWADTFGKYQSQPPTGDAPALTTLAAEVRRLTSELGCIEAVFRERGVAFDYAQTIACNLRRAFEKLKPAALPDSIQEALNSGDGTYKL